MKENKSFRFLATLGGLKTVKEGGIKITLDIPDIEKKKAAELMHYDQKLLDVIINIREPESYGKQEDE